MLSADAESEVPAAARPARRGRDEGAPTTAARIRASRRCSSGLRPELAAIEVGRHNTYGHPAPSTLAALHRAGAAVYRTDRDGTVSLTVDGPDVLVDTEH